MARSPQWLLTFGWAAVLVSTIACGGGSSGGARLTPAATRSPTTTAKTGGPRQTAVLTSTPPNAGAGNTPAPAATLASGDAASLGPVAAAREALAREAKIDPGAVTVVSAQPKDWPDACLGLGAPGESCARVVTPGYEVRLKVPAGHTYVYHTDLAGNVRLGPVIVQGQ